VTLIVGILCKGGVVMASDSAATFGAVGRPTIGQQVVRKVIRLNDHILYASTGAVGMSQVIGDSIKKGWDAKAYGGKQTPETVMNNIGNNIANLVGPYLQIGQWQHSITGDAGGSLCKSIVAMPVDGNPHLFQFDFNGAPERSTKELPFVALGSGQPIADPFLALLRRLLWSEAEPSVAEGRLAAVWAIDHVRRTNPGGVGGPIQLATLASKLNAMPQVIEESDAEIQEHLQKIESAEKVLVAELRGIRAGEAAPAPPAPPGGALPVPDDNKPVAVAHVAKSNPQPAR
jgi:20S proteasome alpha/beta subunit